MRLQIPSPQYSNMNDSLIAQLLNDYKKATDATSRDKKIKELLEKYLHENMIPEDVHLKYLLADFYFSIPEKYTENDESGTQYALNLLVDAAPSVWRAKTLLRIVEKGLSKDLDDVSAVYLLGYLYYTEGKKNSGKSKQCEKGIELLKKAAENNHFAAAKMLSDYFCGEEKYTKDSFDYTQTVYYHYFKLKNNENELAKYAYRMGQFSEKGVDGQAANKEEAIKYYRIAKQHGHDQAEKAIKNLEDKMTKSDLNKATENLSQEVHNASQKIQDGQEETGRKLEEIGNGQAQIGQELKDVIDGQVQIDRKLDKIQKSVDAIPEETRKLIFVDLNTVTDKYKKYFDSFKEMHDQLEKGISDIKWTVDNTKHSVEELSAKMQEFYDKMEERCVTQAKSTKCANLREACEAELKSLFGNYWTNGQLLKSTQESLIAARVLLACAEREGVCDCRGIVISATSALERELKARFYNGLQQYFLKSKAKNKDDIIIYPDYRSLPKNLQRKKNSETNQWEDKFTLGDVFFILSPKYDVYGIKSDKDPIEVELTRKYIKTIISDDYIEESVEELFINKQNGNDTSFCGNISSIAAKYRNPAAHSVTVDKITAEECCKKIIGESKSDVETVESCLFDLLKLTGKFKHKI